MTLIEWALEAALVLALAAALPQAIRLERALSALRRDRAGLADSARDFATATRDAEAAVVRLRAVADGAGRDIAEQLRAAAALRDDLRFLSDRAEGIADRMETGMRGPRAVPTEPAAPVVPRARAEAELMRALRSGRSA